MQADSITILLPCDFAHSRQKLESIWLQWMVKQRAVRIQHNRNYFADMHDRYNVDDIAEDEITGEIYLFEFLDCVSELWIFKCIQIGCIKKIYWIFQRSRTAKLPTNPVPTLEERP